MGSETYNNIKDALEASAPLKVTCTAESVAESIVQFIEGHSVVTGQHLILDGGHYLT